MTPRRLAVVAAAVLGAFMGVVGWPAWQDAIEPAQVLAGLVVYPADAPVGQYSTRTWTLLHQLPAAALWLGLSDATVNAAINAVLGALAYAGLALVIALGRPSPVVIALAPMLILQSGLTRFHPGYPVGLFGLPYTYGVAAQMLGTVVLALAAHGATRTSLFLLGLFPAVHIAFGSLLWCVAGLTWFSTRRLTGPTPWRWFFYGAALTVASFAIHHVLWVPRVPVLPPLWPDLTTSPEALARLTEGARLFWDDHRQPLVWTNPSVIVALVAPPLLLTAWRFVALPPATRRWPIALTMAIVVGFAGLALAHTFPSSPFGALIPNRIWNISLFTLMATTLALGLRPEADPWIRAWASVLIVALALLHFPTWPGLPDLRSASVDVVTSFGMPMGPFVAAIGAAGIAATLVVTLVIQRTATGTRLGPAAARVTSRAMFALLVLFCTVTTGLTIREAPLAAQSLTPPPALEVARNREGLLLTSGNLHTIQAWTRRAIVIDGGALDFLPYVPSAAPVTERALQELYGVSLTRPLDDWGPAGSLPPEVGRATWEARLPSDWRALAKTWRFTDIVTPHDWRLQLPRLSVDRDLAVWDAR